MTRNHRTAKDAGTRHTASICDYLAGQLENEDVEPRNKNGAKDRGDVTGVHFMGQRLVIECKDYGGDYHVGPWLKEAEIERGNDDAGVGMVVAKRRGYSQAPDQVVFMTLRDLMSLMTGERPE